MRRRRILPAIAELCAWAIAIFWLAAVVWFLVR